MTTWVGIVVAVVLAVAAWMRARGVSRRLDLLTQQYWDLRYQHGELRARLARLDPEARREPEPEPAPEPPAQTFIPLSSLKR